MQKHERLSYRLGLAGMSLAAVCALGSPASMAQNGPKQVKVDLKTAQGQDAGRATFRRVKQGVELKLSLKNLPFGEHGVHVHQNAVCEGPDFKTAGGHYNPGGKQHGYENPLGHHAGDLPKSVSVGEDHNGSASFLLTDVSLDPSAANSLFAHGGTSVIVHEKADDMKTDPSGNSGNRIACGVVKP